MDHPYQRFVSIEIDHDYDLNSRSDLFHLHPDPECQKMIQNHQLLVRFYSKGFDLVGPQQNTLSPDHCLRFFGFCRDPNFHLLTSPITNHTQTLYCHSSSMDSEKNLTIQVKQCSEIFTQKTMPFPMPHLIIDLQNYSIGDQFKIHLHNQSIYWKYVLFGHLAQRSVQILDLDSSSPQEFMPCNNVYPHSQAFMSVQPIPLQARYNHRFQLRDRDTSKILMAQMPHPNLSTINKETNRKGMQVLVAETFIHP